MLINLLRDLLFKNIANVFHVVFECENTFDIVSSVYKRGVLCARDRQIYI